MGTFGPFRRAHIIPDAFMRRAGAEPFMESDGVSRSKKRFTGWYDPHLLGIEGEALIARYDAAAARCFIERGLTYRTRRSPLDPDILLDDLQPDNIYTLNDVDTNQLRLFALSLLWRSAATSLAPFSRIRVSPSHLSDIGARLRTGDAGDYREYPLWFGVFDGAVELTKVAPEMLRMMPMVRFFLDGVVCYVCPRRKWREVENYGGLITGWDCNSLVLYCHASLTSHYHHVTSRAMRETYEREGDVFAGFSLRRRRIGRGGATQ